MVQLIQLNHAFIAIIGLLLPYYRHTIQRAVLLYGIPCGILVIVKWYCKEGA
jgi:hypothetical protein